MEKIRSTVDNLDVLYEDNHLIAVNKRPGDIVQGDKTGDLPLSEVVQQYLKIKYNKPYRAFVGVVHRLDRPTSGVILFARTSKAMERVNKQFASREVQKMYWAIVQGTPHPQEAELIHYMMRNTKQNKSYAHRKEFPFSKYAKLQYQVMQELDHYTWLQVQLFTGRHHQIRAQISSIGHPIKGDMKYQASRSNKDGSIHLHARSLTIVHPVRKEPITFTADPPEYDAIWKACMESVKKQKLKLSS